MPAFKFSTDKIEVIDPVNTSTPQIPPSTDAPVDPVGTYELFYQVLDRLAKLEKDMTGKALDPNEVPANNIFYGMPPNYFSGQSLPPPDMSKPKTANAEGMAARGSAAGQTAPPGGQTTGTGNQTAFASGQIKPTNALETVAIINCYKLEF
jgi:hypothetical protein